MRRNHEPWLGYWDVPGGFCGTDEHPIIAAEREILEETGLKVRATGLLGMWLDEYGDERAQGRRKVTLNIYYHAVPIGKVCLVPDPAEVAEAGWFLPDALPGELAFPGHLGPVLHAWRKAYSAGQTVTALLDRPT